MPSNDPQPHPDTQCARPPAEARSATRPLVPPLNLSVVYQIDGLDQVDALYGGSEAGWVYARDGHPNAAQLAAKLAELEGAEAVLIGASGMSAEAAVALTLLGAGDHVALSDGLYGKSVALIGRELVRFGIAHTVFDATRPDDLLEAITPTTRLVFVETLSNPLLRVADLPGLAEVARDIDAVLIVDNTFAPLICQPITHGANAVTHSLTKLIGGHSDLTLGALAGTSELIRRATSVASTFGLTGNPFECWLCLRGLATLALRSDRACRTAIELAHRLATHPKIRSVHYPGLASHPDHDRAAQLLRGGYGTIATIDLGGRAEADTFLRALEHIPFAPSLGDVATTLSHPATTSHRGQTPEQWARQGITPGLVRLSIGLENVEDLWREIDLALAAIDG